MTPQLPLSYVGILNSTIMLSLLTHELFQGGEELLDAEAVKYGWRRCWWNSHSVALATLLSKALKIHSTRELRMVEKEEGRTGEKKNCESVYCSRKQYNDLSPQRGNWAWFLSLSWVQSLRLGGGVRAPTLNRSWLSSLKGNFKDEQTL